jgi:uncharacterized protein (TIGR02145 family)
MKRGFIYKILKSTTRFPNGQSGFSLIDVLLVVAILTIILASAVSIVPSRTSNEDLHAKSKQIVEFVAQARNYSMSGYFGDVWGIKVLDGDSVCQDSGDCLVMFKGKGYSYRDSAYDRILEFDTGVYINSDQINEFHFSYKAGWLSTTTASSLSEQSIVLNTNLGTTKTIHISPTGMAHVFTCGESYVYDTEGQAYRTVEIDGNCWMAENLNTGTTLANAATDPTDNGAIEKWCYDGNLCDTYGGLYMWDEAMGWSTDPGVQGICPAGWHLPTNAELSSLVALYDPSTAGTDLKENGQSGFDLILGGEMNGDSDVFDLKDDYGILYSSSELGPGPTYAFIYYVRASTDVVIDDTNLKTYGFSIRCLKD